MAAENSKLALSKDKVYKNFASKAERIYAAEKGLYSCAEHDACGVGLVAHVKGEKSHQIITNGLRILQNLDHRGATGADPLMGDGTGILLQIPDAFFRAELEQQGVYLPELGRYGVGMIFLPKDHRAQKLYIAQIENA